MTKTAQPFWRGFTVEPQRLHTLLPVVWLCYWFTHDYNCQDLFNCKKKHSKKHDCEALALCVWAVMLVCWLYFVQGKNMAAKRCLCVQGGDVFVRWAVLIVMFKTYFIFRR
jgi:hypothetical protein